MHVKYCQVRLKEHHHMIKQGAENLKEFSFVYLFACFLGIGEKESQMRLQSSLV